MMSGQVEEKRWQIEYVRSDWQAKERFGFDRVEEGGSVRWQNFGMKGPRGTRNCDGGA